MKTLKRIIPIVIIAAHVISLALVDQNMAATVAISLSLIFTAAYFLVIEE